jgi:hypothetical protein
MATDYAASVNGVALRVTKLDASGEPLVGLTNSYLTTGFMSLAFTPEYTEGEEIEEKGADGNICVYFKMPDVLKRVTFELALCAPDPEVYEILHGGTLLQGGGTPYTVTNKALTSNVATLTIGTHALVVGNLVTVTGVDSTFNGSFTLTAVTGTTVSYAKTATNVTSTAASGTVTGPISSVGWAAPELGTDPTPNGVSLEIWSRAIVAGKPASTNPYWRWVFPYAQMRLSGDRTLENGLMANVFEGYGVGNDSWGDGPVNDWTFTTGSPYQYARTSSFPSGSGYQEVEADA